MTTPVPDLERFDHDDAWQLGSSIVAACRTNKLPVAVLIQLGEQRVFHAGLPGSSADNDRWAERKSGIVRHFGQSSFEVSERYATGGDPMAFLTAFALSPERCFPAGGAVPIRVRGTMVGVLAVSGLESNEDHELATAALRNLKEEQANL